jgi:aminopeptidase N
MFEHYFKYFILFALFSLLQAKEQYIHHDLTVELKPGEKFITVTDIIEIPAEALQSEMFFLLHANLTISSSSPEIVIKKVDEDLNARFFDMNEDDFDPPENVDCNLYNISGLKDKLNNVQIELTYEGEIHHPVEQLSKEYARGFSETPGIISDDGVYLAGSTFWLPWFNDRLVTFNLTVSTNPDWRVVSQGKRVMENIQEKDYMVKWESPEPMDEIFLIAARFQEYHKQIGNVNVLAYLRTADVSLANKYLETTAQYLEMYNQLIGQYPYTKFALIENFWETGYGMPSFTLLGQKVIRFPFILHSSYPHELLHNWWGNSVFVDYKSGNWCEGLTAYMADQLIKEQRGQGVEYRRTALQAYTDYVNRDNEFPLSQFISRTDATSSSIGYNKSMMLFHMLRREVGDDLFRKALQNYYRKNKFKRAGFADIKNAFEEATGNKYEVYFDQWVNRSGAPVLELVNPSALKKNDGYQLNFTLRQTQSDDSYQLSVPIAIHLENEKIAAIANVNMDKKEQSFTLPFKNRPLGIDVDPQFDVFRRLDRNEIPPSLSQVFGAEKIMIILPSDESEEMLEAYEKLAISWSSSENDKIKIMSDDALTFLPADRSIWLFGINNKFKPGMIDGLAFYDIDVTDDQYRIGKSTVSPENTSVILSTRNPRNEDLVLVWLSTDKSEAMPGLGRKLPHYGKYSYLAFEGNEPTNILKGQWPAVNSPLSATIAYDGKPAQDFVKGEFPGREALATLAPVFSEKRMSEHVKFLASEELEGRGLGTAGIDEAANYIASEFEKAGLIAGGDESSYFQTWQTKAGEKNEEVVLKNVIGIIPGKKKEWQDRSVVIAAHYDHLGLGWPDVRKGNEGKVHYGADDNASGVAVMIELAQLLGTTVSPDRTIVFIAFTGEESGLIGSEYYVNNAKKYPVNKIIGAINLDTVGRLGKNKILVLNSASASEWKHIAMGIGFVTGIPYELVTQDLEASDQVSFIKAGVPAIQIFSGPNHDYHRPSDTADKIDAAGMVKVATFTREALIYLAEREDPMNFVNPAPTAKHPSGSSAGRKVGTGVMPDFAFQGEGVRVGEVTADSPAANAGIQKGDVIIKLGDKPVANLKEYSNALKTYQPGDKTTVIFVHDGQEVESEITLTVR